MDPKVVDNIRSKFERSVATYGQTITVGGVDYQAIITYKKNNLEFDDLAIKTAAPLNRGTIVSYESNTYVVISEVNTKRYGVYYEVVLRRQSFNMMVYIVNITKIGTNPPVNSLVGKFYLPVFISTASVDESGKYYFGLNKIVVVANDDPRIVDTDTYFEELKTQYTVLLTWFFEGMNKEWVTTAIDLSKPGLRLVHCTEDTSTWNTATKEATPFV